MRVTNPKIIYGESFTDRDHGEGFVLSACRAASRAGKSKHIISDCIHTTRNGCMKGKLLGMCQDVIHQTCVTWVQMYNNYLFSIAKICYKN
jgi:hypothetical protein